MNKLLNLVLASAMLTTSGMAATDTLPATVEGSLTLNNTDTVCDIDVLVSGDDVALTLPKGKVLTLKNGKTMTFKQGAYLDMSTDTDTVADDKYTSANTTYKLNVATTGNYSPESIYAHFTDFKDSANNVIELTQYEYQKLFGASKETLKADDDNYSWTEVDASTTIDKTTKLLSNNKIVASGDYSVRTDTSDLTVTRIFSFCDNDLDGDPNAEGKFEAGALSGNVAFQVTLKVGTDEDTKATYTLDSVKETVEELVSSVFDDSNWTIGEVTEHDKSIFKGKRFIVNLTNAAEITTDEFIALGTALSDATTNIDLTGKIVWSATAQTDASFKEEVKKKLSETTLENLDDSITQDDKDKYEETKQEILYAGAARFINDGTIDLTAATAPSNGTFKGVITGGQLVMNHASTTADLTNIELLGKVAVTYEYRPGDTYTAPALDSNKIVGNKTNGVTEENVAATATAKFKTGSSLAVTGVPDPNPNPDSRLRTFADILSKDEFNKAENTLDLDDDLQNVVAAEGINVGKDSEIKLQLGGSAAKTFNGSGTLTFTGNQSALTGKITFKGIETLVAKGANTLPNKIASSSDESNQEFALDIQEGTNSINIENTETLTIKSFNIATGSDLTVTGGRLIIGK